MIRYSGRTGKRRESSRLGQPDMRCVRIHVFLCSEDRLLLRLELSFPLLVKEHVVD